MNLQSEWLDSWINTLIWYFSHHFWSLNQITSCTRWICSSPVNTKLNAPYTCAVFCLSLTFQRWTWWPVWAPVSAGLEGAGQPWPPGWGRRELTAAKLLWRTAAEASDRRGTPGAGWRRPCRTGRRRPWASLWRTKEQKVSERGDLRPLSVDRLIRFSKISVCTDCQAEGVHVCLAVMWLTNGWTRGQDGLAAYVTCLPAQVAQNGSWLKYCEIMRTRPGRVKTGSLFLSLLFKTLCRGGKLCFSLVAWGDVLDESTLN